MHHDIYKGEWIPLCTHCYSNKRYVPDIVKEIDGYKYDELKDTLTIGNLTVGRLSYQQYFKYR